MEKKEKTSKLEDLQHINVFAGNIFRINEVFLNQLLLDDVLKGKPDNDISMVTLLNVKIKLLDVLQSADTLKQYVKDLIKVEKKKQEKEQAEGNK